MTDYFHSTGNSGTMMIRDMWTPTNGNYNVEFWITSNNTVTYVNQLGWTYYVNNSSASGTFRYNAGAGWQRLAIANHWTSGNVTFHINATGTSGLGGPTDFVQWLNRATAPSPPSICTLSNIGSTSIDVSFTDGADNGAAIDARYIYYGRNESTYEWYVSSDGSTTIEDLEPGTTYYFWARTHNSMGYSDWGPRSSATTLRVPDAPSSPVISALTQVSCTATFAPNGDGGAAITAYEVGYGKSSSSPSYTVSGGSPRNITGLDPASNYYFWARAQNSVGWSPWSASSTARTIAGARVKVGTVWKEAIPYVRVSGVWRLARPWGRIGGVWKETN